MSKSSRACDRRPRHEYVTLSMTRAMALELGLLTCGTCGHPEGAHFGHGTNPCAHCGCTEFKEDAVGGVILK